MHPVKGTGTLTPEYAVAGLVIGCLLALFFIRRGFGGVHIPGVGAVNIAR